MIPKSGNRFSDKIMLERTMSMIPKSGNRFSENIMLKQKSTRVSTMLKRKRALASLVGRIFCGKSVSTPDQVRGRLFPENALWDARPWQLAGFS
jgi:hypothetical protein